MVVHGSFVDIAHKRREVEKVVYLLTQLCIGVIIFFFQISNFAGSAWKWNEKRNQFYYHAFEYRQPDLNYSNPRVVESMKVRDLISFKCFLLLHVLMIEKHCIFSVLFS